MGLWSVCGGACSGSQETDSFPDDTEIELRVSGREEQYLVSLDSRITSVTNDTLLKIKKTSFEINMIAFNDEGFLKTIRKKLLWGEDRRN